MKAGATKRGPVHKNDRPGAAARTREAAPAGPGGGFFDPSWALRRETGAVLPTDVRDDLAQLHAVDPHRLFRRPRAALHRAPRGLLGIKEDQRHALITTPVDPVERAVVADRAGASLIRARRCGGK